VTKKIATIEDLQHNPRNANRGTVRGHTVIEQSIRQRGAGRSGLAAADGTMIAGDQTLLKMAELGIPIRPIHTDGKEWVVVIRDDIEPGSEEATLLGLEDNRSNQLGLEWEPDILKGIADSGIDLSGLFTAVEWAEVSLPALPEAGNGGDEFDPTPEDGPTRTQLGELWSIGGVHRLLVGDCTDAANVARLMGGERAALSPTDPPYNVDIDYDGAVDDLKSTEDYERFSRAWFGVCEAFSDRQLVTPGWANLQSWCRWFDATHVAPRTLPFSLTSGSISNLCSWEPIFFFGRGWGKRRANDVFEYGVHFDKTAVGHPVPKPVAMWIDFLENYSDVNDIILEMFLGSGTTLIAAHRTGRRCYGMEIAPRYADVILRRAESEGLACERVDETPYTP